MNIIYLQIFGQKLRLNKICFIIVNKLSKNLMILKVG